MLRVVVGLLGLVLGIIVGGGLVLANPLAWLNGLPPLPAELAATKTYRWDRFRGIEIDAASLLNSGRRDTQTALTSPALAQLRIGVVVLPASAGTPAALAVKVATVAEDNSLWRAKLGTHDTWNVFWLGEGSIFAAAYSNYWGLFRDVIISTATGGDAPAGEYPLSAPSADYTGVTGAAGRYAGYTGEIREALFPATAAGQPPDWALSLKVNPPPVMAR